MENENQELNQEQEAQNQEARTYTQAEYDELLKENSALKEQQKASTKEAQKLHWISEVATDNTKFFKLYRSDKKQAEAVAKHFGWSASDFYNAIKDKYGESDGIDMDDVEAKADEIAEKKFAQKSLDSFKKEFGIEGKLEKVWKSEFDGLMDGKAWNSEEVIKQAKRALKLVRDTDEFQDEMDKANSRLAGAGITGGSKADGSAGKSKGPYERWKAQEEANSIFSQYGKKKDF